jgi:hypothetical protein
LGFVRPLFPFFGVLLIGVGVYGIAPGYSERLGVAVGVTLIVVSVVVLDGGALLVLFYWPSALAVSL